MKIRTQLVISIALFCVALLIVAAAVVMTNQQVDQLNNQQELVKNIELGAGELGYLSNDYLLYNESYQLDRWDAKYAEFSGDVANLSVNTPEQQALVSTIKGSQLRLNDVFNNVVSTLKENNPAGDNSADKAYIQVSWNRLAVQTRGIIFDASRLEQMLQDEQNQVKQTSNLFIMALLGAFGVFILIDYLLVFGGAIKSIGNLQAGTKVVGSGNLDYTIEARKGNEIGDLAAAFNQMTARLKTVTASRNDLEKEIAERKQAEEAIRRQAELIDLSPDAIIACKPDGTITFWSHGAEALYGYAKDAAIGNKTDLLLNTVFTEPREAIIKKLGGTDIWAGELTHTAADGRQVIVQSRWLARRDSRDDIAEIMESNVDITARKRNEDEREISVGFLRIVNDSKSLEDLIRTITTFVQEKSDCEAVGIRLRRGDDYPYFETRGFSKDFVLAETHLCLRDNGGLPVIDTDGAPALDCMCGNVIRGRFDPSKPFFSARGSFWTNNTTRLLATTTEADRQARTRNRCNGEGYESVAVIAIRLGGECIGLLQMNDRRIGRFTPESVAMWERLVDNLAAALAKFETDRALRESEERFRALADNIPNLAWMAKADGWIFWYNRQWCDYTGMTLEEMQGWGWQKVHHPDYIKPVTEEWSASIREGKPYESIFPLRSKDGSYRWFLTRVTPIRDNSGNIQRWFGTNTDITELKHAEESIRRQADMIDLSPDAIMVIKPDGTITFWSYGAETLYGYSRDEAIGKNVHVLLKKTFPVPLENMLSVLGKTGRWTGELVHTTKDGSQVFVQSRWLAKLDGQGNIIEILESNVDITDRKLAEQAKDRVVAQLKAKTFELEEANEELEVKNEEMAAQSEEIECSNEELRTNNEELQRVSASLHETQEYLESLINNANAPIIVWDPAFAITRFNRAFERLSGYMAGEVLGNNLSMLFPPESREGSLTMIKKTLEGQQWESVEIPILHKYGSVRIALWNSANIYDVNHVLRATIAQGQDITRRKEAEKDLEDAKSQAELYLDLMGHDISNMHQIMMMQLELAADILKADGKLEGDDSELIDSSLRTLEKAARLINNVRKLQKHRSGEYIHEPVDLTLVLKDVLKDYSDLPGKDIDVRFGPDGKHMVQANPLLKDVFSNIVDNAVKHTSGPLTLAINISKVSRNGSAFYRVAIEDNGSGIPDDRKEEVFHRFRRGQTKARGTGLGLYIVKTLVESFGGYVEVQNRVLDDYTQGTRFLVYLQAAGEGHA